MAATAYTSLRRSSTSSTRSGSGSDYSDAGTGPMTAAKRTRATRGVLLDDDDYDAYNNDTKDVASSSSLPSVSATATPSPANFLSLAETSLTPLSMDSDLFSDRGFDSSSKAGDKTGSPSPYKQQQQQQQQQQQSTTQTSGMAPSSLASYAVQAGHEDEDLRRSTRANEEASSLPATSAAMRSPHASATSSAAATRTRTAAADEEANVSGARDTATEIEAAASHAANRTGSSSSSSSGNIECGTELMDWNAAREEHQHHQQQQQQQDPQGEGEQWQGQEDDDPRAISRRNPRQRRAGSTPLSLDPLQMMIGTPPDNDKVASIRALPLPLPLSLSLSLPDNDKERDSAPAPPAPPATHTQDRTQASTSTPSTTATNSNTNAQAPTGASASASSGTTTTTAAASTSPRSTTTTTTTAFQSHPFQSGPSSLASAPVAAAPLALRTKNISDTNSSNIASGPPNTSSASAITSPAASTSSPSTVFSAPAAFTRQISTSSLRSTSSLISQIQDSLQQQQQQQQQSQHHHHHSSSGAHLVRPVAKPIVRTTSDSQFTLKHPVPDLNCRSGAYIGNVAALEKSAERLSMTSSIEDAIRDLHGELKRSDSRRSSILAASVAASQSPIEEPSAQPGPLRVIPPVASIVELNNAARLGGYSPSGYVMSPNHSMTGRLRSGSKNSSGRPEIDVDAIMSRHGPGKGSTRSVRSGKPSLAEIAESEPVALTGRVLDEADHAPIPVTADDDATIRRPNTHYEENPGSYHDMFGDMDRQSSGLGLDFGGDNANANANPNAARDPDDRPPSPRSTSTFDHANAFGDFDGVHCQPEDLERGYEPSLRDHGDGEYHEMPMPMPMPMSQATMPMPEPQYQPPPAPRMPPTNRADRGRPQSYFDPLTGQEMLYYPARVPAMLNLPPKLSKKPKTEVRNARHSKVLQAMGHPGFGKAEYLPQDPEAPPVRESKMWLPDPLAGHGMTSFGDYANDQPSGEAPLKEPPVAADSHVPSEQGDPVLAVGGGPAQSEDMSQPPTQQRRKSKMPRASQLPPQLRASAFFELPSTTPKIEMKEGSAMATLDSILDASANAPVSAFTDHAFAGKLGSEVYGPDKKKNRKSTATAILLPEEHVRAASQKKKGGLTPFGKGSNDGSRKNSMAGSREENQALSDHVDGARADKAEGESSGDEEEQVEDEFAGVLDGPPTTLLAELQLRKYHARMRTQNPNRNVGQNGMHATLIELDAVAETQKRHREKKKVALAWEDGVKEEEGSSDEDDVPLGVLYASQPTIAERNRPLGLMERRDLEENEPLSARRARLHGHEPPKTLGKQSSNYTLNAGLSQLRLHQMPSTERMRPQEESDDDEAVEGETLAERMRRLKTKDEARHNNLPSARPVSKAFSAEMLAQFGDADKPEDKGKEKETQPEETEETLGQRRKRLQAEREAREREMMLGGGPIEPEAPLLRKKHSMADVLGSHPIIHNNPALEERRRIEQEQRKVREQEAKMAAIRAQMPTTLTGPNVQRTGGYMNGAFNDGTGGNVHQAPPAHNGLGANMGPGGWNRSSMAFSSYGGPLQQPMQHYQQQPAYGGHAGVGQMAQTPMNGYGGYTAGGMGGMGGMNNMNAYGMPMQMQPMSGGMGMQQGMAPMQMQPMQMQPGHNGQMQNIERWRQSVMY
ncbi:hypothetical protein CH35J_012500 [Colletotrichum higginsianum]|uniref:Uncharacterized protein n=1 Tax=Colletotrichum higginsianum TaxID=80884 RepID=A0A4T0VE31_9PEZI|nr:hypothetical protein CH35J_012500 [Colletotrichum higginsianum]